MRISTKRVALAAALAIGTVTAGGAVAAGLEPDGMNLRADFVGGGSAELELEDRNSEPAVCFIYSHPAPQSGDSFSSRILTRAGAEVVDLGTADQWIEGAGEGCEVMEASDRYREVFSNPSGYIVEFTVVENQGTPATAPVRSGPLQPDS